MLGDVSPVDALRELIREKGILTNTQYPNLTRSNGTPAKWVIDLRPVFLSPEGARLCAQLFWERYKDHPPFQLASVELGSIPLGAALQAHAPRPVNHIIVRKQRKPYGKQAIIEGEILDLPVVVVDDLVNSGRHITHVMAVLEDAGLRVSEIFSILSYENPNWAAILRDKGYRHTWFFSPAEFGLKSSFKEKPTLGTFQPVWRHKAAFPQAWNVVPQSSPLVYRGKIYFGTQDNKFWCLGQDGKPLWVFNTNPHPKSCYSSPAVAGRLVIFGSYDGNLYALDRDTGELVWSNHDADWIGSSPCVAEDLGLVFCGLEHAPQHAKGSIAAFSLHDGACVWRIEMPDYVHASPAYDRETRSVLCGSNDGVFVCADALTGALRWTYTTPAPIKYTPTVSGGFVIYGGFDRKVRCHHILTGKVIWETELGDTVYSQPLVVDGEVWVSCLDKYVHVLDLATGAPIAKVHANGRMFSSPRIFDGSVWVGTNHGRVLEIDPKTHEVIGKLHLHDKICTSIAWDGTQMYALCHDGTLVAFRRLSARGGK
jgi:outer membrane protein assembly factor BamB/orotate phosphoribosyltransferase